MGGPDFGAALNAPLAVLRAQRRPAALLQGSEIVPGLHLRLDPAAQTAIWLGSPRERLLELDTKVSTPGAWLGLHLTLPLRDMGAARWIGFVMRASAGAAMVSRACLRSGFADGGFQDQFFDRHLLTQAWQVDHHDLLALDHCPHLPRHAEWREFVLFLPPDLDFRLSVQNLRIFLL